MYYYKVYGLIFESNIKMPQLVNIKPQNEKDASILVGKVPAFIKERKNKKAGEDCEEGVWFHNSRAYYWATANEIIVEPKKNQKIEDIIPFIQGYCFALLFRKRGLHAQHCSALYGDKGVVLIGGYSGSGKSTITNRLLQDGYRLMADDVAILTVFEDKIQVYPGFPIQKLCQDMLIRQNIDYKKLEKINEGKNKYLIDHHESFYGEPAILHKFILLDRHIMPESEQVVVKSGTDMLLSFIDNLFLSDTLPYIGFPPTQMKAALDIVTKLDAIYKIYRTEGTDSVDKVYSRVMEILQ